MHFGCLPLVHSQRILGKAEGTRWRLIVNYSYLGMKPPKTCADFLET